MSDRLAEILTADGFPVERPAGGHPAAPAVVVRFDSGKPGRTLEFNGHLDTVHLPFVPPQVQDGRITGSGSSDMKAGVAAAVEALLRPARQRRPAGRLDPARGPRPARGAVGRRRAAQPADRGRLRRRRGADPRVPQRVPGRDRPRRPDVEGDGPPARPARPRGDAPRRAERHRRRRRVGRPAEPAARTAVREGRPAGRQREPVHRPDPQRRDLQPVSAGVSGSKGTRRWLPGTQPCRRGGGAARRVRRAGARHRHDGRGPRSRRSATPSCCRRTTRSWPPSRGPTPPRRAAGR